MYKKIQIAWLIVFGLSPVIGLIMLIYKSNPEQAPRLLLWFISAIILLFYKYTLAVQQGTLTASFGIGLLRKTIHLNTVQSCTVIKKNPWYAFLFNLSGFETVEILLKNGGRYRLLSDEPGLLCDVINKNLQKLD